MEVYFWVGIRELGGNAALKGLDRVFHRTVDCRRGSIPVRRSATGGVASEARRASRKDEVGERFAPPEVLKVPRFILAAGGLQVAACAEQGKVPESCE